MEALHSKKEEIPLVRVGCQVANFQARGRPAGSASESKEGALPLDEPRLNRRGIGPERKKAKGTECRRDVEKTHGEAINYEERDGIMENDPMSTVIYDVGQRVLSIWS